METKYIWTLLMADYEKRKDGFLRIELFLGRNKYTKTGLFSGPLRRCPVDLSCNDCRVNYLLSLDGVVQTGKNGFCVAENTIPQLFRYFQDLHMEELYCRLSDKKLHHVDSIQPAEAGEKCCFSYHAKTATLLYRPPLQQKRQPSTTEIMTVEPTVRIYFKKETTQTRAFLYFLYDTVELALNDAAERIRTPVSTFLRNHRFEQQTVAQLLSLGGNKSIRNEIAFPNKAFFERVLRPLSNSCYELYWGMERKRISKYSLSCSISYKNDWFLLSGAVAGSTDSYQLTDLLRMSRGRSYVEIGNEILFLPEELQGVTKYACSDKEIKISRTKLFEVNRLAHYLSIEPKSYMKSYLRYLPDEYPLASSITALLKDYQIEGLRWMLNLHRNGFGGCLADDMGLGKTIQAIFFLSCINKTDNAISLIIVPKIVLFNWQKEFSRFAPDKAVTLAYGNFDFSSMKCCNRQMIYITTYDTLLSHKEEFCCLDIDVVILDEAQYVKNHRTKRYEAIHALNRRYLFALTGTPIENNVAELWSLFNLINPGMLGKYGTFIREYGDVCENAEKMSLLKRTTSPFLLRRTKEDVLKDLPAKTEAYVFCEMEEPQREIYERILTASRNELMAMPSRYKIKDNSAILQALLYLREACVDTQLLPAELRSGIIAASCKFELFQEYARQIIAQSGKLVVFCQFPKVLQKMEKWCKHIGWDTYYLDGKTSHREKIIEEFEAAAQGIFFISLKAGGVGLNLVSCQYVIIYEPWWNIAAEQQAANRIYRIGQTRPVFIYHFLTRSTIEEKVHELQCKKAALSEDLLEGTDQPAKISLEDLADIIFEGEFNE